MYTIVTPKKTEQLVKFVKVAPPGAIVEVGVYQGGMLDVLTREFPLRQIYGYDTFAGMPETGIFDNYHTTADFVVSLEEVERNMAQFPNVILVKGIYPGSDKIKPSPIAMAHVDVDIYESTYNALCYLAQFMAPGGRIYCDDALVETCHGATLALCRFCHETDMTPHVSQLVTPGIEPEIDMFRLDLIEETAFIEENTYVPVIFFNQIEGFTKIAEVKLEEDNIFVETHVHLQF